jgi:hypothetical protein
MEKMTFDFKSLPLTKLSKQIVPSSMPHFKASTPNIPSKSGLDGNHLVRVFAKDQGL